MRHFVSEFPHDVRDVQGSSIPYVFTTNNYEVGRMCNSCVSDEQYHGAVQLYAYHKNICQPKNEIPRMLV